MCTLTKTVKTLATRHHEDERFRSIDAVDRDILLALAQDGRITYVALGALVGLSANAATERVRRLEQRGLISGYHAQIDPAAIGRRLSALIDLRLSPGVAPARFETAIHQLEAVREVTFLTGRFDYQLLVACTDTADLDRTLRKLRSDAGAAETETRIILRGPMRRRRDAARTPGRPRG